MTPAHTNWLPIGIIGIVLGIILIFAGGYAENYQQLAGPAHDDYGMPLIRVSIRPYANLVFPLEVFGLCALVVGIVGVLHELYHHLAYVNGLDLPSAKEEKAANSYARDFLS